MKTKTQKSKRISREEKAERNSRQVKRLEHYIETMESLSCHKGWVLALYMTR